MCKIIDEPGSHTYSLRVIIPRSANPRLQNDDTLNDAIDEILDNTGSDIINSSFEYDETEISLDFKYKTSSRRKGYESYWDDNGGDPGDEYFSDDLPFADIEKFFRTNLETTDIEILEEDFELSEF